MLTRRPLSVLLVAVASMIVSATAVSAQQPADAATDAVDSNGFPLKAPGGWNQKYWDETLRSDRANTLSRSESRSGAGPKRIFQSQICRSVSAHRKPAPGAYLAPESRQAPAKGAVDSNGFPVKAPAGWSQKFWDETLGFCDHIAQKARAHKELEEGEIAG